MTNPSAVTASNNFVANGQLDWNAMYVANGNSANAGKSVYALYEDRTDDKLWSANSYLNSRLSDNIYLNAGVNFRKLKFHVCVRERVSLCVCVLDRRLA